ncbi:MAG: delta-aminolevulinic acid dehydratase [Halioglobus sp.]
MNVLTALAASLGLLCAGTAAAADCECLWRGGFADVQAEADLVVTGEVIAGKGNSIDLQVERQLRGDEPGQTVRVWLKAADYCRPERDRFPPGSRWVMALERIDEQVPGGFNPHTPNISYGAWVITALSSCGGFWLSLVGERVTGNLVDAPRWDHAPNMNPVLLDLIAAYVRGELSQDALREAAAEDPALRELILDTRAFLRDGE